MAALQRSCLSPRLAKHGAEQQRNSSNRLQKREMVKAWLVQMSMCVSEGSGMRPEVSSGYPKHEPLDEMDISQDLGGCRLI